MMFRVSGLLLLLSVSLAQANPEIGVFPHKNLLKQEALRILVAGANSGEKAKVDVHVGLISPSGRIYEYPDWNTSLRPWLKAVELSSGFKFDATQITRLETLPGGNVSGMWRLAGALTKPGTLDIISFVEQPFQWHVGEDGDAKARYGIINLLQFNIADNEPDEEDFSFIYGAFWLADEASGFAQTLSLVPPNNAFSHVNLNSCAYIGILPDTLIEEGRLPATLDAGKINLSSSVDANSYEIEKIDDDGKPLYSELLPAVVGLQLVDFTAVESGQSYTVTGKGGPDVGGFAATVIAPEALQLTSHAGSKTISHNATNDMHVVWQGGSVQDRVSFTIAATLDRTEEVALINCQFVDEGSAVIPAASFLELKKAVGNQLDELEIAYSRNASVLIETADNSLQYGIFNLAIGSARPFRLQ